MHAWSNDVEALAKNLRETLGLNCHVYDFSAWDVKTVVVRLANSRRFIEFIQPLHPENEQWQAMGRPGTPGVFGINLKVADMDKAIAEMKAKGIKQISDRKMGEVRQCWFDTEKLFGVQVELSEYPGESIFEAANVPPPADV
jgi:hypothetical protein